MEHLWRRAGAAGGNHRQVVAFGTAQKSLQTAASACHHLRRRAHGKEGVGGSSPSEGSAKALATGRGRAPERVKVRLAPIPRGSEGGAGAVGLRWTSKSPHSMIARSGSQSPCWRRDVAVHRR